jgi:hypothetical protein
MKIVYLTFSAWATIHGCGQAPTMFELAGDTGDTDTELELAGDTDTELELAGDTDTELELGDDTDTELELGDTDTELELGDTDTELELGGDTDTELELGGDTDTELELGDTDTELELGDDTDCEARMIISTCGSCYPCERCSLVSLLAPHGGGTCSNPVATVRILTGCYDPDDILSYAIWCPDSPGNYLPAGCICSRCC